MSALTSAPKDRVLIVDDDPSSIAVLDAHLRALGYVTESATTMQEASTILLRAPEDSYHSVITDYWMPGGTGLDLLRVVRNHDPTLAFVLLTSAGSADVVEQALREGIHGYMHKPIAGKALAEHTSRAVTNTKRQRHLLAASRAAQEVGRNQMKLLRHQCEKLGQRLQIHYQPFDAASGDFLSVLSVEEGSFVILASDTSGHDMNSAYQSSYFHGLSRGMLHQGGTIEQVFELTNKTLLETVNADGITLSLSAIAIRADLDLMRIQCLNAGFPFPYLVDGDGMASPLDAEPTNPLGWFDELSRSRVHTLPIGHIVFWSDGLDDLAERQQVDPLSLACRLCSESGDRAKLTIRAQDDIIVIRASLGMETTVADQPFAILARAYPGDQLAAINSIQTYCENSLRTALPWIPEDRLSDILVCLREALINALKHGCKCSPDQIARVQASYHATSRLLRLRVSDSGPGHNFDHENHADVAAEHLLTEHRGLLMIKSLPNSTYFSGRGSIATMDFQL